MFLFFYVINFIDNINSFRDIDNQKTKTYFKGHHSRFIKIDISGIKGWLFTDEVSVY